MPLDDRDMQRLRKLFAEYPRGWEPKDPTHPFFDRAIAAGYIKRADGRFFFEAMKDTHIVFTEAGKVALSS